MKFDKVLTIIISIVIIAYVFLLAYPQIINTINESKELFNEMDTFYIQDVTNNYITSKPNYYFPYEGAVYCIPISKLVEENLLEANKVEDMNLIIKAIYLNGHYSYSFVDTCTEQ